MHSPLAPGTYTVSEVVPIGWTQTAGGATFTLTSGEEVVAYVGEAGTLLPGQTEVVTAGLAFGNHRDSVIVIGPGKSPNVPDTSSCSAYRAVVDGTAFAGHTAGATVLAQFAPYGNTFQGGVRVATGDLTGDGVDDIVTAPGWSTVGQVRVYTEAGVLLSSFDPYGAKFIGGVQVAVGDVTGDGLDDIITVPSTGPALVKVFHPVIVNGVPTFNAAEPYREFLAFPIIVCRRRGGGRGRHGKHAGGKRTVRHPAAGREGGNHRRERRRHEGHREGVRREPHDHAHASHRPQGRRDVLLRSAPERAFSKGECPSMWRGSLPLQSRTSWWAPASMAVRWWTFGRGPPAPHATLSSLSANGTGFAAFTDASNNSPVEVAALDTTGDGIANEIFVAQGPGGTTEADPRVRRHQHFAARGFGVHAAPRQLPGPLLHCGN